MKYFVFILILVPTITISQTEIKGAICNAKREPLPYTNIVTIKKQNGTTTDVNGEFLLSNLDKEDTLKISNIAYYSKLVSIKSFKKNDTIFLDDNIKLLSEVVIANFKMFNKEQDLGFLKYRNNASYDLKPGGQIAVFIENKTKRKGWIKEVSFKVNAQSKCKCSFRIRLLQFDPKEFKPSKDILNENVIINSTDIRKVNKKNLSDYKVLIPEDGVVVVLEWLYSEPNCEKKSYTQIIGNMSIPINITWFNNRDRNWSHYQPNMPNGNYMTPNIGVTVAY